MLLRYEEYLQRKHCLRNTISLYMRTLRSICNRAEASGIVAFPANLFKEVFTGYEPCRKRAVTEETMRRIGEMKLTDRDTRLTFARDMFMLSFYLRGIPFVDLAHLRHENIRDGVLYYSRSKTRRPLSIRLPECARKIIKRYATPPSDSIYLLPIIKRPGEADEHIRYDSALRLYNKHLDAISRMLGLDEKLTSYVARHSWATIAYENGVSVSYISEGLGHSSEEVTYNYLKSFTADELADMNNYVIDLIAGIQKRKEGSGFIREGLESYNKHNIKYIQKKYSGS